MSNESTNDTAATKPSAGAMRAAYLIMTADDPARFIADFAAEDEQRAMAEIIDRETGTGELVELLTCFLNVAELDLRQCKMIEHLVPEIVELKRASIKRACAALARYNQPT